MFDDPSVPTDPDMVVDCYLELVEMEPGTRPFRSAVGLDLGVTERNEDDAKHDGPLMEAFEIAGMSLGANPIEELIHRFGKWGLNFLLITLAVTPLRRLTRQNWLLRFRRMLGLFAFFYILMHFLNGKSIWMNLKWITQSPNYLILAITKR